MKPISSRRGAGGKKPKKGFGLGLVTVVVACVLLLVVGCNVWLVGFIPLEDGGGSATTLTSASAPDESPSASDSNARNRRNVVVDERRDDSPPKSGNRHENHHLVFSTACSLGQDWQSYQFFYQAMAQGQPGTVTRIVSGCSPDKRAVLQRVFDEQIKSMSDSFRIHFTPEFGKPEGSSYQTTKYWNKPFGVKHWLENAFGYDSATTNSTAYDDDIVILIDPDMFLQRPLVNDFEEYGTEIWTAHWRKGGARPRTRVDHGHPVAQLYGFGGGWLTSAEGRLEEVVGKDSPVHSLRAGDAGKFYAAGPPYVLTARDFYRVALHWCAFVPRLFAIKPMMMNEMYGYSMAAAHLGMPHQLARGFMVSSVDMYNNEGWQFLEDVPPEDICDPDKAPLPNVAPVIHFCQRYTIGDFFISKYKTHANILSCEEPLFQLPPTDAAVRFDYSHFGNGDVDHWSDSQRLKQHQHAFMVCSLMSTMNAAARYYKTKHCGADGNFREEWNYFTHWKGK